MLRLHVHHRTTYSYSEPVGFGRHQLVLRPREGHDLRIVEMQLTIEPAHEITWVRDVLRQLARARRLHGSRRSARDRERRDGRTLAIRSRNGTFTSRGSCAGPCTTPPRSKPVVDAYRQLSFPDEAATLEHWLGNEPRAASRATTRRHAARPLQPRARARSLIGGATSKGVQTPRDTLRVGSGSCRDMATLMMDAARVLGVASRFASGYAHGVGVARGARVDARVDRSATYRTRAGAASIRRRARPSASSTSRPA